MKLSICSICAVALFLEGAVRAFSEKTFFLVPVKRFLFATVRTFPSPQAKASVRLLR